MKLNTLTAVVGFAALTTAQYFPPTPENVTRVNSTTHDGVYVSFKEVCLLLKVPTSVLICIAKYLRDHRRRQVLRGIRPFTRWCRR